MKRVFLILTSLSVVTFVYCQSKIVERINTIKAQSDIYFWNQYTHPVAETAYENACKWLLDEIKTKNNDISLDDLMPLVKSIKVNRGALNQAFVYVLKDDIIGGNGTRPAPESQQEEVIPQKTFVPDVFVQQLLKMKDFGNIYRFLEEQKRSGQLLQFGALKDVDDYDSFDLILFDLQSKQIVTVLSPVMADGKRINKTTGFADSLDNFPEEMIAVIWYIK